MESCLGAITDPRLTCMFIVLIMLEESRVYTGCCNSNDRTKHDAGQRSGI